MSNFGDPEEDGQWNTIKSPFYPKGTPSWKGLHCEWIFIPNQQYDAIFRVRFYEIDTNGHGKFNITAEYEDNVEEWIFKGTDTLDTYTMRGKVKRLIVAFKSPSEVSEVAAFRFRTEWIPTSHS